VPSDTRTVLDVIEELEAIEGEIAGSGAALDGVACFNRLYLAVTRAVDAAARAGRFADADFVCRLDVDFADLYFAAITADRDGTAVPGAWRPLFKKRADAGIEPLQFALAGMNAHINHDLPLAIVATWSGMGKRDRDTPGFRDFRLVNDILDEVQQQVKASFESEALADVDRALGKADDVLAMWSVARARDHAWMTAEALWDLREVRGADDIVQGVLERLVSFAGHGLLR
jgi:hypothetical protein